MTHRQIIASLGLLVIVIAVAVDPFTQQIIHYYESATLSTVAGNATLPRTSQYNIGGVHIAAGLSSIDHGMLGAILGGFWTPSTVSNTVPVSNCLTGNCTFTEPYNSIGMCSSCTDLSNKVSGFCNSNALCNYTLPTGTGISMNGLLDGWEWMVGNQTFGSVPPIPGVSTFFGDREFIWTNSPDALPCGELAGCPSNTKSANTTCQKGSCPVSAAGCYLYPCLNTYTANVSNGILTENLVKSIPMPGNGGYCLTNLRKDCLIPADWTILSNSTINITPSSYPNSDYIPYCNSTDQTTNITAACIYDFGIESQFSLQYFFSDAASFNNAGLFLSGSLWAEDQYEAVGPSDIYVRPFLY
jgi:hypothetical protein